MDLSELPSGQWRLQLVDPPPRFLTVNGQPVAAFFPSFSGPGEAAIEPTTAIVIPFTKNPTKWAGLGRVKGKVVVLDSRARNPNKTEVKAMIAAAAGAGAVAAVTIPREPFALAIDGPLGLSIPVVSVGAEAAEALVTGGDGCVPHRAIPIRIGGWVPHRAHLLPQPFQRQHADASRTVCRVVKIALCYGQGGPEWMPVAVHRARGRCCWLFCAPLSIRMACSDQSRVGASSMTAPPSSPPPAVGESGILLHPPLPLKVGVSTVVERERQQK